jgi:hypothetical protein
MIKANEGMVVDKIIFIVCESDFEGGELTSVPVKQASEDEVVVAVTFFFATPRSEEVGETAGEFLLAPPVT